MIAGLAAAAAVGVGVVTLATNPASGDGGAVPAMEASMAGWRWAPSDELPGRTKPVEQPKPKPKPKKDPKPKAPASAPAGAEEEVPEDLPAVPKAPDATSELAKAAVLPNGVAVPPLEAPPEIREIIQAGNVIAKRPYLWGGGHGKWQDTGYDCSGSVSYALAGAGLLNAPLASGPLMKWGKPGKGKWLTVYSNPGHVFIVVAGVRFDTSAAKRGKTGSRFTEEMRPTDTHVARHWPGL